MTLSEFKKAAITIRPWVVRTPLLTFEALNEAIGRKVYLKCEERQVTGSFKVRGCLYAMLESKREIPKITRSSGNFGHAMAWAGQKLGIPVTVVMPEQTSPLKIEKTRQYGARVMLAGPAYDACEQTVQRMLAEQSLQYIPPSDDDHVIAGQGTIALEIVEQLPDVDAVYGPIGGGGLMSGCAAALKQVRSPIAVVGVEPSGANDYALSRQANTLMPKAANTIADGLRASSVGTRNWPLLQRYLDRTVEVSDNAIQETMDLLFQTTGIVAELSGVVSLAGFIADPIPGNVVCIISGGNRLSPPH